MYEYYKTIENIREELKNYTNFDFDLLSNISKKRIIKKLSGAYNALLLGILGTNTTQEKEMKEYLIEIDNILNEYESQKIENEYDYKYQKLLSAKKKIRLTGFDIIYNETD